MRYSPSHQVIREEDFGRFFDIEDRASAVHYDILSFFSYLYEVLP